jgi:hypothetical protein
LKLRFDLVRFRQWDRAQEAGEIGGRQQQRQRFDCAAGPANVDHRTKVSGVARDRQAHAFALWCIDDLQQAGAASAASTTKAPEHGDAHTPLLTSSCLG